MTINRRVRFRIFTRDNFTCQYCGRKAPDVELEVDHRYPRSLGGGDEEANLVTACKACNGGKHTTTIPVEWTFREGPLDGEMVKRLDEMPVEWVWRDPAGQLLRISDAVVDQGGAGVGATRMVYGPNLYNYPADIRERFHKRLATTKDERRSEILGCYLSWGVLPEENLPLDMYWHGPTQLLLMLDFVTPPMYEPRRPIRG